MGWFLPMRSSRSNRTRRRGTKRKSGRAWDPQRTLLCIKVLGGLAVVLTAAMTWRVAERALIAYANERDAPADVTHEQVVLADAPDWMREGVRRQIAETAAKYVRPAPMDGRSLHTAALALDRDPWVRQVEQVYRRGDGTVEVNAEYREPVAMIGGPDGYHMVDAEGVRLPGMYMEHQVALLGLPRITGVVSDPARAPGQSWEGQDVQAGLALVRLLAGQPFAEQIRAYDVGYRDQRGRIRLVLETGEGLVRWGLPPGQEQPIEPDTATKLARLRYLYEQNGSIDTGGQLVDIYGPRIAVSTLQDSRQP